MRNFHGAARRSRFEGWYLKHECNGQTLCLIPSLHRTKGGDSYANLQVITGEGSWQARFPAREFSAQKHRFDVRLGKNRFHERGCEFCVHTPELQLEGHLFYGPFTAPVYDVMGPFSLVPGMECRHGVWSLSHRVNGSVTLNGKTMNFENGRGYVEGDRGRSFPTRYLWTQCSFPGGSVMLSAADIPLGKAHFPGCIGSVLLEGEELRLATYCGARVLFAGNKSAIIRQKDLCLTVECLETGGQPLSAPVLGNMERVIRENAACRVRYRLTRGGRTVLDRTEPRASFEGCWSEENAR